MEGIDSLQGEKVLNVYVRKYSRMCVVISPTVQRVRLDKCNLGLILRTFINKVILCYLNLIKMKLVDTTLLSQRSTNVTSP